MVGRCPRPLAFARSLAAVVVVAFLALIYPQIARSAAISDPRVHVATDQVTIGWKTDFDGTSELRWDDVRHTSWNQYPADRDLSFVDPGAPVATDVDGEKMATLAGKVHSRTLSYLPAGIYFVMVRSRSANGMADVTHGPIRVAVGRGQGGTGALARLLINGEVTASTTVKQGTGEVTYIAGDFTYIGSRTGSGVMVNRANQTKVPAGLPEIEGVDVVPGSSTSERALERRRGREVKTAVSDGQMGWFIGGRFAKVGGLDRRGIAHILPDGGVDPYFDPGAGVGADGVVHALAVDHVNRATLNRLYIGGSFSTYRGETQNNIVAVDATTGAIDRRFVTTKNGTTGTDKPVYALMPDEKYAFVPGDDLMLDKSGVFFGGAFNTFRGEPYSRLAHTEVTGDRANYRHVFSTSGSTEWDLIKQLAGDSAAIQDGHFEASSSLWVDPTTRGYDPQNPSAMKSDPNAVVTSLAMYDQVSCAIGSIYVPPRPSGFLKDLPLIGWLFNLTAITAAVSDMESAEHKYMAGFMIKRMVETYHPTVIVGGRFFSQSKPRYARYTSGDRVGKLILEKIPTGQIDPNSPQITYRPKTMTEKPRVQAGLMTIEHGLGTFDPNTSNPQMANVERFFPDVGQEIRNDPGQFNGRFRNTDLLAGGATQDVLGRDESGKTVVDDEKVRTARPGSINALELVDRPGCGNDTLYIGGNFRSARDGSIADLAKIKLNEGFTSDWDLDFNFHTGSADPSDEIDAVKEVTSISAAKQTDSQGNDSLDELYVAEATPGREGGQFLSGFAVVGPERGELTGIGTKTDGRVNTVVVNPIKLANGSVSKRAFVGGDFYSYSSLPRPGVAAVVQGANSSEVEVDPTFQPVAKFSDGARVDALAVAGGQLVVGGTFTSVNGKQRGNLASFATSNGDFSPRFGAGGANGPVRALEVSGNRLFIGGAFSKYVGIAGDVAVPCETCSGVAVVSADGAPFGTSNGGQYNYDRLGVVGGAVNAIASAPGAGNANGRVYLGGDFRTQRGSAVQRGGLLAVDELDGSSDERFHAQDGGVGGAAGARVNSLVVDGSALFVGGAFTSYRGAGVGNIAKVNRTSGKLDSAFHDPSFGTVGASDGQGSFAGASVKHLRMLNGQLFAAGPFGSFDGAQRDGIAAVDPVTGNALEFTPGVEGALVSSITTFGDRLLIGGKFDKFGGRLDHENVGLTAQVHADTTPPVIGTTRLFLGRGDAKQPFDASRMLTPDDRYLTLQLSTYDRGTFSQFGDGSGGLRRIPWPQVDGLKRIDSGDGAVTQNVDPRGIGVRCTGGSGVKLDTRVFNLAFEEERTTSPESFPTALAGSDASCTWDTNLLVPADASGSLKLRVSSTQTAGLTFGGGVTAERGASAVSGGVRRTLYTVDVRGRGYLPMSVQWNGNANDPSIQLEWLDPSDEWRVVSRTAYTGRVTYEGVYEIVKDGKDGAFNIVIPITDGGAYGSGVEREAVVITGQGIDTTPPTVEVEPPVSTPAPGGTGVVIDANPANNPNGDVQIPVTKVDDVRSDGTQGSGAKTFDVWASFAPFDARGDEMACGTFGPYLPFADLAAPAAGQQLVLPRGDDGCYAFKIRPVDVAGNHGDWISLYSTANPLMDDRTKPELELSRIGGKAPSRTEDVAIQGKPKLSGTFTDAGSGVTTFRVDLMVLGADGTSTPVELCGDAAPTSTDGSWECEFPFDTIDAGMDGDGKYDVVLTGTDKRGLATETKFSIHIDNFAPTAETKVVPSVEAGEQHHVLDTPADGSVPTLWYDPTSEGSFLLYTGVHHDYSSDPTFVADDPAHPQSRLAKLPAIGWDAAALTESEIAELQPKAVAGLLTNGAPEVKLVSEYSKYLKVTWQPGAAAPGLLVTSARERNFAQVDSSVNVLGDGAAPQGVEPKVTAGDGGVTLELANDGFDTYLDAADQELRGGAGVARVELRRRVSGLTAEGECDASTWTEFETLVEDLRGATRTEQTGEPGCYEYTAMAVDRLDNARSFSFGKPRLVPSPRAEEPAPTPPPANPDPVEPPRETPPREVTPPKPKADPPVTMPDIEREPEAPAPGLPVAGTKPVEQAPPLEPTPPLVPPAAQPPVEIKERAASKPVAPKPKADESWVDRTAGWIKKHPVASAGAGLAAAQVGSNLLFGKGIGALLAKLQGLFGNHLSVPMRALRRPMRWMLDLFRGRRRDDDDDDFDDLDVDHDDGDPTSDIPAPYRPAA